MRQIYQLSLPAQKKKNQKLAFFGPDTTFFVHLKTTEINHDYLIESSKLSVQT